MQDQVDVLVIFDVVKNFVDAVGVLQPLERLKFLIKHTQIGLVAYLELLQLVLGEAEILLHDTP